MPNDTRPDAEAAWSAATPFAGEPRGNGRPRHQWQPANPDFRIAKLRFTEPISLNDGMISERPWLVPGWLPIGNVTMLSGDGGTGKTLLAQMLATCCATGKDWLGQPTTPARALCVFCEDDENEIRRRQRDINQYLGVDWGDLENLKWISRMGDDNAMMSWPDRYENAGQPTEFFQQVHNEAQDFAARLVVVDSLHDTFTGNENARVHARQFVQLLASLARDSDGAVLLNAHPSMSGRNTGTGESGSTAWNNAVRSRLYLTRPQADEDGWGGDPNARVLRRMKANYASVNEEIRMNWRAGVFVADVATGATIDAIEKGLARRVFLDLLDAYEAENRPVSDSSRASNYAPKLFGTDPRRQKIGRSDFEIAMRQLFADGTITNATYGRKHDERRKIQRVLTERGDAMPSA